MRLLNKDDLLDDMWLGGIITLQHVPMVSWRCRSSSLCSTVLAGGWMGASPLDHIPILYSHGGMV